MLRVIAIDGPAGSGKSTVARAVASALGLGYLDTGAMYRSVAFAALRRGIDPADAAKVTDLAGPLEIEVGERVLVDGEDATVQIRGPEVTAVVSAVAAHVGVREELRRRQQLWAEERGGGVVEGRDIGTVVFPDARVKVFLTASDDERARRRAREHPDLEAQTVATAIARRDHLDSTRAAAPLAQAADALILDTTGTTVDEVVEAVLTYAKERLA